MNYYLNAQTSFPHMHHKKQ
uniref:Uncharacterized protein n=1 Tax=Anguilla anguilla TaxID=7936 RepID=A0A0E9PYE9_ANGAN